MFCRELKLPLQESDTGLLSADQGNYYLRSFFGFLNIVKDSPDLTFVNIQLCIKVAGVIILGSSLG